MEAGREVADRFRFVCVFTTDASTARRRRVFYRFFHERVNPGLNSVSRMTHRARQPFEAGCLMRRNVIVDFQYSSSPRVTCGLTTIRALSSRLPTPTFRRDPAAQILQPQYKSCTTLLADITSVDFGFDVKPLDELVHWGDIIVARNIRRPESAVALSEPQHNWH